MKTELAKIFKDAGDLDDKKDGLGAQCVAYLIKHKAFTSEVAEALFAKAHQENGWSMEKGRPKAGSTLTAAPPTVKNYISALRNMYKFGLDIREYATMGEIRRAVNDAKAAKRSEKDSLPSLVGVQITKADVLTGALVHDIYACIKAMPPEDRDDIEAKLRRVLAQAMKKAPPELKLVA
jgi:hypothetical protein